VHSYNLTENKTTRSFERDQVEARKRRLKDEISQCMRLLEPEQQASQRSFKSHRISFNEPSFIPNATSLGLLEKQVHDLEERVERLMVDADNTLFRC
jgi:hypothetical protein